MTAAHVWSLLARFKAMLWFVNCVVSTSQLASQWPPPKGNGADSSKDRTTQVIGFDSSVLEVSDSSLSPALYIFIGGSNVDYTVPS